MEILISLLRGWNYSCTILEVLHTKTVRFLILNTPYNYIFFYKNGLHLFF